MAKKPQRDGIKDEVEADRSPAETAKVRDATLRRMLNTPPKPHKEIAGRSPDADRK